MFATIEEDPPAAVFLFKTMALLEPEFSWTKRHNAELADGTPTSPYYFDAAAFSIWGALMRTHAKERVSDEVFRQAWKMLRLAAGVASLTQWQEAPNTTYWDVQKAFGNAISMLKTGRRLY